VRILNADKLHRLLGVRHLNLSQLARGAQVSRQSLYGLLKGQSVYNKPFLKVIRFLQVEAEEITKNIPEEEKVLADAPKKIQVLTFNLLSFCKKYHGSLILFGSRASGRPRLGSDWDFGVYFPKPKGKALKEFQRSKPLWIEGAFPHRADILNFNESPRWFWDSIRENSLVLFGEYPDPLRMVS
jgi:hypothetical protein